MNDERSPLTNKRASLDTRLSKRPDLAEALHRLVDEMEESLEERALANDVEDRVAGKVREIAQTALTNWAAQAETDSSAQLRKTTPQAVKHAKKNSSGKRSSGRSKSRSKSGE